MLDDDLLLTIHSFLVALHGGLVLHLPHLRFPNQRRLRHDLLQLDLLLLDDHCCFLGSGR